MSLFYAYFLGLWLIGPFDSMAACDKARQWQRAWGGEAEVTECWVVIDTRARMSPVTTP